MSQSVLLQVIFGASVLLVLLFGAMVAVYLLALVGRIYLRPRTSNALFLACMASLVAGLLLMLSTVLI